ncbi:hypothetical protein [Carboxylicivirga marina]|uniref:hypothetical protein n=1 Tax=Carboxylicivirga marina TaxID=2800988 RepID=UPI0025945820|nr:hypothetical protein [uncultured Carboxylicivirga sp.]
MKKINCIILMLLLVSRVVASHWFENDSTIIDSLVSIPDTTSTAPPVSSTDSSKIQDVEFRKEFKETIEKINQLWKNDSIQSSEKENLGVFVLKNELLELGEGQTDTIQSISILVKEGAVFEINVLTKSNRYFNTNFIVPLSSIHRYRKVTVYERFTDNPEAFNILNYIAFYPEAGKRFYRGTYDVVELNSTKKKEVLEYKSDLNSIIDVRIYTDLLGLIEKADNGIIQTDISTTFDIGSGRGRVFLFKEIDVSFGYSRLDENAKNYQINSFELDSISKIKIDQLAYINFGANIDILTLYSKMNKYDLLKGGISYSYTNVLHGEEEVDPINIISMKIGTGAKILKYDNFGAEFNVFANYKQMRHNLFSDDEKDNFDGFLDFDISMFYRQEKGNNKYFVRFRNVRPFENGDYYNLLQFGISSSLSPKSVK